MSGGLRILPFGDRGILAEVSGLDEVLAVHARLAATRPDGVVDLVPAARTVLVHVDPRRLSLAAARAWVGDVRSAPPAGEERRPLVEIPVVYDGADLDDVAAALGIRPADLAATHAACEWTVAFTGFAPGFGYLVSAEWPYDVPRRSTPRTRVPAGAVGLAGGFTGAYPRETPGGWQLIGTTPAPLFDAAASPPVLLPPGTRVRFTPTVRSPTVRSQVRREAASPVRSLTSPVKSHGQGGGDPRKALTVVEAGLLATLQDQGRAGSAAEGIAVSGAMDRAALRTAHRLLGTSEDAAGIEITMGGFRAVADDDLRAVVAGAWGPIRLGGRSVDPYTVFAWPRGAELHVDWFAHGARAYLAVRGGLLPAALGEGAVAASIATDTLAGLGPAPLRAGDALALADPHPPAPIPPDDLHPWGPLQGAVLDIDLAPGPRADWFADAGALFDGTWTVSAQADRVGIRLDGPGLHRRADRAGELPSEGMLPGAIQVPPDGRPVILGPDGPVTGGYPVIAVVADAGRDRLAQARPGTRLRFRHARG